MVSDELGTKRTCPSCAARFYDLGKSPIVCPKCGASFIAEALLPSRGEQPPRPVPKPAPVSVAADDDEDIGDVDVVSLEDVEVEADDDADIADVDLGGDGNDGGDDVFLEEEEEEADGMGGLIGGKPGEPDEV